MITATTRELPATRDPIGLNQRSTTIAMLEHFANQLFLSYGKWGTLGAERLRFRARTAREKGALCAFLYKVHRCHLSFYLHLRCEDGEERELLEGLGMPAHLFVGEDGRSVEVFEDGVCEVCRSGSAAATATSRTVSRTRANRAGAAARSLACFPPALARSPAVSRQAAREVP